jgi:mono/diheme cytochrome c family protein
LPWPLSHPPWRGRKTPRKATPQRQAHLPADGCFTCHGRSGQGGAYTGPAPILAHTALPFDGFEGELRNPANDMPAYSEAVLSDKDIVDIYAFVQSLPGPRSSKDISILNK